MDLEHTSAFTPAPLATRSGLRVLAFPGGRQGVDGCAFYRLCVPLVALEQRGDVQFDWLHRLYARQLPADVIIGQRIVEPPVAREWQILKSLNPQALFVYELDDDIFQLPRHHPAHGQYLRPEIQEAMRLAIGVADRVIVSTHELRRQLLAMGLHNDIRVCPNRVPASLLDRHKPAVGPVSSWPRGMPILGWAGSATHNADLATVLPALIDGLPRNACGFHMMGGDRDYIQGDLLPRALYHLPHDVGMALSPFDVTAMAPQWKFPMAHTPWIPDVTAYLAKVDFDICVIPLEDNAFNASKSPLKAMEMAAMGIPVVAQRGLGVYDFTVDHGVTGYLYDTPQECLHYVARLLTGRNRRAAMGRAARELAREQFTINSALDTWANALRRTT